MLKHLVLALGVVAVGCANSGAEAPSPTSAAADGLSIVSADEAAGQLVLSARKAGHEITIELRLGPDMMTPPSESELAANPELPTHEIDARLLDRLGRPFHMQIGGDAFIDPSWTRPVIEGIDETLRAKDFELARAVQTELMALKVPTGLEELRKGALQISRDLEHIGDKADGTTVAVPTDPGGVAPKVNLYSGSSYTRYWDYYVAKKDISFTWGLANHSAVALRGWSSSYGLLFTSSSCNHGTCASSMSRHCTMSGYRADDGTRTRWFYSDPSTSTGTTSGGCRTPYYWNSACGGHNCNDDSQVQGESIYYDRSYDVYSGGHCDACGARYSAPNPPGCG